MKSPFNNFHEHELETYSGTSEIFGEMKDQSPFLNAEQSEGLTGPDLEFEMADDEVVDEEESAFDLHESEDDAEYERGEDAYETNTYSGIDQLYEHESPGTEEPLAVPESRPVPFAPVPVTGGFWPIVTSHPKGREVAFQGIDKKYRGNVGRRFLASRTDGGRYHVGIDLWANHKDPIVACEDGTIVNFYHFYRSTYALLVEHKEVVINYGEVDKDSLKVNNLKIGDKVKAGQAIGLVGKMYSSSMLHFETYVKGTKSNKRFQVGGQAPKELLNPTKYLLFLKQHGMQGMPSTIQSPVAGKKDWTKTVELNRHYSAKLGWLTHIYTINDLLLKVTGQSDISLAEEAFAEAVSRWQSQNGFSQKDCDGVIGPNTWNKMKIALGITSELAFESSTYDGEWQEEAVVDENVEDFVYQENFGNEDGEEEVERFSNYEGDERVDEMGDTETDLDHEEWEEDWLETSRTTREADDEASGNIYTQSETLGNIISHAVFNSWYNAFAPAISRFPNEPKHNIDQLPVPPWLNVDSFYESFIQKHGGDARTIIGDATKKVHAQYFVLHDTAVAADFKQNQIKGKGIHLWVNAQSPVLLGNDWNVKGLGVKLERKRNNAFVHVEITRDKELQKAVQHKTKGKKISSEEIIRQGGIKNFGTYYTDKQYELVAYAYLVASLRRGKFLTVTIHREVDRSVVVKRANNQYGYGHDDPQFFDLDHFYAIICRLLGIPAKLTFGIQSERALAQKQGNMAGHVNSFIPFVTGDVKAANQYGPITQLNPKASKYKVVKLKHGYYYDVTGLKNQFQQNEIEGELSFEVPVTSTVVPPLIAEDQSIPGYTCYVRIDLGKANYPLSMTGIYVPSNFNPKQPVDVVLYLHGMTMTFPGSCAQIIDYWNASKLPAYDLRIRDDINASGRNVVLVAPSLGDSPNKYQNQLSGNKRGLDQYMEKVLLAVNTYIVKKRFNVNPIEARNVVIAAHSAGGLQMLKIAISENPVYGPKISECWGFDSMYGNVVTPWLNWAARNRDKKLVVYYQSTTEGNTKLLASKSTKLPNVFTKKSPAKNHYWVVRHHLKERVMKIGQSDLTKVNFEEGLY
jgi:murein DD-endopeptidase MepM/ murein hydrolase activator NlpD